MGTTSRNFIFGQFEGRNKPIVVNVEDEIADDTEAAVAVTAQTAAAASTQRKSKQCRWLYRLGHLFNTQSVRMDSLDISVDAEDSKSKLQESVERKMAKTPTADMRRLRSDMETLESVAITEWTDILTQGNDAKTSHNT